MSDPNQPSTPAGWYPDGQGAERWWDGTQWSDHTRPIGGGDAPSAPEAPSAPSAPSGQSGSGVPDMPTVVAPNRAAGYQAGQQPGQPQYGAPQQPQYGAPQGSPGGAPQYGAPQGNQFGGPQGGQFGGPGSGTPGKKGRGKGLLIGIIVGVVALVAICGIGGWFLVSNVLGGNDPESVAEDFLSASQDGDYEGACELLTEDAQQQTFDELRIDGCGDIEDAVEKQAEDTGVNLDEFSEDFETEFEITDVSEDGDTATVTYESTTTYTGDDEATGDIFADSEPTEETLELVKEDGDWKVKTPEATSVEVPEVPDIEIPE